MCSVRERGVIVRRRSGGVVELVRGSVILLSSAALETERAFGRLAASIVSAPRRVLVGGLGFGATVRGVLDVAPAQARVVVVEKLPEVERLLRGPLAHFDPGVLDDPRVSVVHGDVANVFAQAGDGELDVVLLDVDNGPHWASFRSNARLYTPAWLATVRRVLAPMGGLAVWSGYRADAFLARLRTAGFTPSLVPLRERERIRARAYVGRKDARR